MILLLACATPAETSEGTDTATTATAGIPEGRFAMTLASSWEGDCAFDDPLTYADAEEWTFDPRGDVLVLYRDYWTVQTCTPDGLSFSCDDGSYEENRMQVGRSIEGTFEHSASLSGAWVLTLDCGGNGCDSLRDLYGKKLDFPCTATAPFSGTAL